MAENKEVKEVTVAKKKVDPQKFAQRKLAVMNGKTSAKNEQNMLRVIENSRGGNK